MSAKRNDTEKTEVLEAKIKVLQEENNLLADRAEEILLLGLVSESINKINEPNELIENVLEKISVLKNIPYVFAYELENGRTRMISFYSSEKDQLPGDFEITFSEKIRMELDEGAYFHSGNENIENLFINSINSLDFTPNSILIIPFYAEYFARGVFLFFDSRPDDELNSFSPLLQQIVNLTVEKIDKIALMEQLKALNRDLEQKVKQRTEELKTANIELKAEIIQRNKAEQENRKLLLSVEQSPVSIIITDVKGKIEYVNPKFERTTGYRMEEVLGQNPRFLKSGETDEETYRRLWEVISAGKEWGGEIRNKRKNGELYWEKVTIAPIKNEKGKISQYLAIEEDTSELKKLQEQLYQAQKMESLGSLAGGISHDFNNLLTIINGHAELAAMRFPNNPELVKELKTIGEAGSKAAQLTQQLLAFSRKQVYRPAIIDVNQVIYGLEKMLRRLIGEDILIEYKIASDLPFVKADPIQIEQILINLAVNARDAIRENSNEKASLIIRFITEKIEIDKMLIKTYSNAQIGEYVLIKVEDTGVGMDAEIQARIFDPFFTTKEKGRGTGLGLSTVYGIVRQNGGFIDLKSIKGKGSCFQIFWPVTAAKELSRIGKKTTLESMNGNETILIVEDDKEVREFLSESLQNLGYKIIEANGGSQALSVIDLNSAKIDLMITDIIMPGMNGRELAIEVGRKNPNIKTLFTSGYTNEIIENEGELESGLNFLAKPYNLMTIARKIREILK